MAALQLEIARRVAECVKPGGRLVYAVCSVLNEECDGVVNALLQPRDGARQLLAAPFDSELGRKLAGDESSFRLLPHVHGCDGYFVASFVVR
jgi:16S rRNA (cytosine967-C5)-methyltransferase